MSLSDAELYNRIRKGDRQALAQLYERREPALYRYAVQACGSREIAEEAVQEAFLTLIRQESGFDPRRGSLEAYLYGVVRNLTRAALRHQTVEVTTEPAVNHDIAEALIGNEMTQALHRAVRELPDGYRDAVVLCDLEERSYEDAAAVMGCPVGTVRSRVHRARRLLAEKMRRFRLSPEEAAR